VLNAAINSTDGGVRAQVRASDGVVVSQRVTWFRVGLTMLIAALVAAPGTAPASAQSRGQGTVLVHQDIHCGGSGNSSTVYMPFALHFTRFPPNATGTVSAYTQPGGQLVGTSNVTLDAQGNRCVEVSGDAPPGQYKIVYDFGSGTGKQKVIRLVTAPTPTPTVTPSHPIATVTPTSASATPTTTSASPSTTSASPTTTSASPSTTSASPSTTSASPTTTSASPSLTSTSTGVPTASVSPTDTAPEFVFTPEALAPTGASQEPLTVGLALALAGLVLILFTRRGSASAASRRH